MHKLNEAYISDRKVEAVRLAKALLAKEVEFLVAIRNLSALRHVIGASSHDEDFKLFLVVDSQTDHLPAGEAKAMCSKEWLLKSEKELKDISDFYHFELVEACEKIIERFSVYL